MIKVILLALTLILAVFGLSELIHNIRLLFVAPKRKAVTYSVVLLTDNYSVEQMNYLAEQRLWHGSTYADYVIAVNKGLTEREDTECERIAKQNNIFYCSDADIESTIKKVNDKS